LKRRRLNSAGPIITGVLILVAAITGSAVAVVALSVWLLATVCALLLYATGRLW
jgi:hypothetical protein